MNRWFVVAPASVALGWLLNYLHVPAAWILGAILCSGAMALGTGRDLKVNTHFYALCRGIIGVLAAVPLIGIPAASSPATSSPGSSSPPSPSASGFSLATPSTASAG